MSFFFLGWFKSNCFNLNNAEDERMLIKLIRDEKIPSQESKPEPYIPLVSMLTTRPIGYPFIL